jgi:hypothetical protein
MLGVNRQTTHHADDKVVSVEHTMQAYIKNMAEAFREYLPKKTVSTIFLEGVSLSKFNRPDEAEIKEHLGMGYMRAIGGCVLDSARRTDDRAQDPGPVVDQATIFLVASTGSLRITAAFWTA